MSVRIQKRRGTAAAWTVANPVLAAGETGLETDTGRRKTGDGTTAWTGLAYEFDATAANGTYTPRSSTLETITYNADGTVATVTETDTGAVVTYTYNADGTVATEARLLGGVTTTRTFGYSGGNIVSVT